MFLDLSPLFAAIIFLCPIENPLTPRDDWIPLEGSLPLSSPGPFFHLIERKPIESFPSNYVGIDGLGLCFATPSFLFLFSSSQILALVLVLCVLPFPHAMHPLFSPLICYPEVIKEAFVRFFPLFLPLAFWKKYGESIIPRKPAETLKAPYSPHPPFLFLFLMQFINSSFASGHSVRH